MKYKCLVMDHDDTVVQSMKTLSYPFFLLEMEQFRPGRTMSFEDYVLQCHRLGFEDMCRQCFGFTDEEMVLEHKQWMAYILQNIPAPYPGIGQLLKKQKEAGGLICVVSHSSYDNIVRDYSTHFGFLPDAIYGWDLPAEQRKPNPWPLQDIMRRFCLTPEEILVVDDMKLACAMAKPLGVSVAYSGWNGLGVSEVDAEMKALCDYSYSEISELEAFLFAKNP